LPDSQQLKVPGLARSAGLQEPVVTEIVLATTLRLRTTTRLHLKNPVRYKYYRTSCGREARLQQLWGEQAGR
jgi:peptide-methionine (S)-S-oxide reductase